MTLLNFDDLECYLRCREELSEIVHSSPQVLNCLDPAIVSQMQIYLAPENLGAEVIKDRLKQNTDLRDEIEEYIASVDDDLIRHALILRFAQNLSWEQIAIQIQQGYTPDTIRSLVSNYVDQHP